MQSRTVEALLPLAAHCILMGAEVNKNVEGLELAVCTMEKCEIRTDLDKITEFSKGLDRKIAKSFVRYRK